jgi:hypothetical protein
MNGSVTLNIPQFYGIFRRGQTYTLLRNLTAPNKPKEKDYTTLVNLLRDHLTPKPIVIAERFRFHTRNQLQCESVNAYIAELRKLTEFCAFGLNLNDTLRDRFVCGLRNDQIQKKLLTIRELSLDKALEIAVAMETATKNAIELRNVQGDTPVHKVLGDRRRRNLGRSQPQQAPKLVCYRCNGTDHLADKCRFKEVAVSIATAISNALSSESSLIVKFLLNLVIT